MLGRDDRRHREQVDSIEFCWAVGPPWTVLHCTRCDFFFPLPQWCEQRCGLCGGLADSVGTSCPLEEMIAAAGTDGEWRPQHGP